jgi:NAD(P)-dependent dehydrogenase (short-subunit alcohol dehydrogenase family)
MDAWVVGGTSGIGLAIVENMTKRGITTVALSNDRDAGAQMAGQGYSFEFLDLARSADQLTQDIGQLIERTGIPRYVFLCAAITEALTVSETPPRLWDRLIQVNLMGVIYACHAIAEVWRRHPDTQPWQRHFVFLGSVNALRPLPSQGAYSVTKAGLHAYARCLANDLASDGVRVNLIAPGAIWTPMNERLLGGRDHDEERRQVAESALVPRFGTAPEIAQVATWLVLESPPFVMGTELVVDGGYMTKR